MIKKIFFPLPKLGEGQGEGKPGKPLLLEFHQTSQIDTMDITILPKMRKSNMFCQKYRLSCFFFVWFVPFVVMKYFSKKYREFRQIPLIIKKDTLA